MKVGLQKLPILKPHSLLKATTIHKAESHPPLDEYFNSLFTALGPQHWWPAKTPFEIIIAAGKNWCRKTDPRCTERPLGRYLEEGR